MELSLDDQTQRTIDRVVRDGRYRSPEEVIAAAVAALVLPSAVNEFEPGEWDRLLAEGEASIVADGTLDGESALAARRARRRAARGG